MAVDLFRVAGGQDRRALGRNAGRGDGRKKRPIGNSIARPRKPDAGYRCR